MTKNQLPLIAFAFVCLHCSPSKTADSTAAGDTISVVKPVVITEAVQFDTDDPAIWINHEDTAKSLIVGTDKDENGGLYVFDLNGKILPEKSVSLKRPNNVDIEYGLLLDGKPVDIAVATERLTHKLRIFTLPEMTPVDNGGIEAFEGETEEGYRDLMGISLYKNPEDQNMYAIVGRKTGPLEGGYLWQYLLEDDGLGQVKATLVRKFGKFSGKKEIESIAVDDELGYVYYSDEQEGVRKYYADPAKGDAELALFGVGNFAVDNEGISIYQVNDGTGYILVSDQGANHFNVYPREGTSKGPHDHPLIKVLYTSTEESDGSEVTSVSFPGVFSSGLFVAMSTDKTFQLYRWEDLAGKDLMIAPDGISSSKSTDTK